MRKNYTRNTITILLLSVSIFTNVQAQNARIKIDLDRTIGEVDKNVYGNFVEHWAGVYMVVFMIRDQNCQIPVVLEKM
jgi:alpha-N-arabinofuranosidase